MVTIGETCKVRTDWGDIVPFRSTVVKPYFRKVIPLSENENDGTAMRMDNAPSVFEDKPE